MKTFNIAKKKLSILIGCCSVVVTNYAIATIVPMVAGAGGFYTQTTIGTARNNDVKSAPKTGKVCAYSILSMVAFGDASINAAKNNGSITNVASVDNTAFNVLGLYGRYCTIVKGN